jgi:DNA-binding NtrC family response regulator
MSTSHILVVDDEPSMLRYLQTVLELDSYRVSTASNGLEAVDKVERDSPDLVLLDMVMPGADGLETLQRIREARPSTKVVMLSCVRDTRKVAQAMRLGAQDYLSKPVQKEEMDEVLRFCLENTDPAAPGAGDAIEVGEGVYFFSATPLMRQLRAQAMQVAKFDFPVLLLGESGTGKEVLARLIHKYSDRAHRTFLKVNCAAVPSELLESELFGYEPGAFTGANKAKPGKFELCNKGTLLLDEIGEMSPALQAKLLQVLQDGQFSRLGGRVTVQVDVRVLAATNINMPQAIAQKTFREDLYYRLNSFVLRMPSLRERREEIPMILRHFMIQLADKYACAPLSVSQRLVEATENYSWPGNIRELENFVKRFLVLGDESAAIGELQRRPNPDAQNAAAASADDKRSQQQPDLKEMVRNLKNGAESEVIAQVLEETAWNRKRAATKLNISYKALLYKIRQYDIRPRQATTGH